MSIAGRIDPEIAPVIAAMPELDMADLEVARRQYRAMMAAWPAPNDARVSVQDMVAPAREDNPPVEVRVFSPQVRSVDKMLPAICWVQGGGYVLGGPLLDEGLCQDLVLKHHCVVASVRWRRAPEHPFPAPLEDCYGVLAWMALGAHALGIDANRLIVAGATSGGGLAAGAALLVRDRGAFSLAHQLLIYPMLDDRNDSASAHLVTDENLWNRRKNEIGWRAYLSGGQTRSGPVSPYAAPARMEDLAGSVPASILTGELDLFRDENIIYAMRLMAAGVPTELHVYPAAPHGFDQLCQTATVSRRFTEDRDAILARVLARRC